METLNPEKLEFLIKINADYFLAEIHERQVTGTAVLSAAFHGDYRSCDRIASGLRPRGYPQAIVCDALGRPVTADMLALATAPEVPAKAPLPKNLAQLNALSATESRRRYKSEPDFKARVDQLYQGR